MAVSQNGYTANDVDRTKVWYVPDTDPTRYFRLRRGAPGFLLMHFVLWLDERVERLDRDRQWDDWGYAERDIRGSTVTSNHASGTAVDVNATQHPMGVRGTFSDRDTRRIRRVLRRRYKNLIRWGGDYSGRPDEMHFEINPEVSNVKARVRRRARRLRRTPRGRRILREQRKHA